MAEEKCKYLVTDTNILIRSLPFIRAITDLELQPELIIYVPYRVLQELDCGASAAPVNQLLSHHMRRNSKKIYAQSGQDHRELCPDNGAQSRPDDEILKAAIRLQESCVPVILVTNDHNLMNKACASGFEVWDSAEILKRLPAVIERASEYLAKDLRGMCPNLTNVVDLSVEVLCFAVRGALSTVNVDTTSMLIAPSQEPYSLLKLMIQHKLTDKVSTINSTISLLKMCRSKAELLQKEQVQRWLRYSSDIIAACHNAKALNNCVKFFAALSDSFTTANYNTSFPKKLTICSSSTTNRITNANEKISVEHQKMVASALKSNSESVKRLQRTKPVHKRTNNKRSPKMDVEDESESPPQTRITLELSRPKVAVKQEVVQSSQGAPSTPIQFESKSAQSSRSDDQSIDSMDSDVQMECASDKPNEGPKMIVALLARVWSFQNDIIGTLSVKRSLQHSFAFHHIVSVANWGLTELYNYSTALGRCHEVYMRLYKLPCTATLCTIQAVTSMFFDQLKIICADSNLTFPKQEDLVECFEKNDFQEVLSNAGNQLEFFRKSVSNLIDLELKNMKKSLKKAKQ